MRDRWLLLIWVLAAIWLGWWAARNPFADGYQNEYLHVGAAFDLWEALARRDTWHLRWFMYTGYWPWGFLAVPWPFLWVMGEGRSALLAGNLVHLAVLLVAARSLGRRLNAPLAPLLVVLCPGVFGTLVRFEPNLAAIAWTAAGLAALMESDGLSRRGWTLAFGACLGVGLMMDRLSVAFFLLPALIPVVMTAFWTPDGRRARGLNLLGAAAVVVLVAGAYYREFLLRQLPEVLSQVAAGEIDSAGQHTETGAAFVWLWYPLAVLDTQAGLLLGGGMLVGLGASARAAWRERGRRDGLPRLVLLAAVLGAWFAFAVVVKKQVFYTLPVLPALAVLAATRPWLARLGVLGGLLGFLKLGVGVAAAPGGPWLPSAWLEPHHLLARPPIDDGWPLDAAAGTIGNQARHVAVLADRRLVFEGFVVLLLREKLPGAFVRGVSLDPEGTYEMFRTVDVLVRVGDPEGSWPTAGDVDVQLRLDHRDPAAIPPVGEEVAAAAPAFDRQAIWQAPGLGAVTVWRRRPVDAASPAPMSSPQPAAAPR
jgi:hypothetical protein